MLHVNVANGEVCYSAVDFSLPGIIPFEMERRYNSFSNQNGLLGWNWNIPLNNHLAIVDKDFIYRDQWDVENKLRFSTNNPKEPLWLSDDEKLKLIPEKGKLTLYTSDFKKIYFPSKLKFSLDYIKPIRIEDLHGNAISFIYDEEGLINRVTDTFGRKILVYYNKRRKISEFRLILSDSESYLSLVQYSYDDNDNLVKIQDSSGQTCHFEYEDHLIVRGKNKLGGSYYANYDGVRRCIATWKDGGIKSRKIGYDERKHTTYITNALGYTTVYKCNEAGFVVDEISPSGGVKSNLYDENNNIISTLNEINQSALTTIYNSDNRILTVTDASGATTLFKDNDKGQIESKIDAVGATWNWHYDEFGHVIKLERPSSEETHFEYDNRGLLSKITNSRGYTIHQSISNDGKMMTVKDEYGLIMRYRFDEIGNLIEIIDGNGASNTILRDLSGRIVEKKWPDGNSIFYTYNNEGNLIQITDELGNKFGLDYDKFGKCIKLIGPQGEIAEYEYDLEENPIAIVNEKRERHLYLYDSLGRVIKQKFFDGNEEFYQYDELGNIVQIIDGEGRQTYVTYDEVRNITEKIYPDGTREQFSYDGLRRLTELHNDSISIHFEWDAEGNLIQEMQGDRILNYAYDSEGNQLSLEDSGGRLIQYDYDLRNRLIAMRDSASGEFNFDYDLSNLRIRHEYPNGAVLTHQNDKRNRIIGQSLTLKNQINIYKSYTFDPADRMVESSDSYGNSKQYTYDSLDRILSIKNDKEFLEKYSYDLCGNITFSADEGHFSYVSGNLLSSTSKGVREYDRCGALIKSQKNDEKIEYEYDGAGRLANVTSSNGSVTEFAYDALGRRISKKVDGKITRYVWNGFTLLEESQLDNKSQYLFDLTRMEPLSRKRDHEIDYFASDRRGCIFATMDEQSNITGHFDYSAFGSIKAASVELKATPPFRLRGQYYDEEIGLHYNFHRYYEPTSGSFINRDPLGMDAGRNLYSYGPNPITWEDAFGLSSECQGDVFYRAMSDKEKKKVMEDCQLHAKSSKCPEGPYVTKNKEYCERAQAKKPDEYKNLVEICTKPGTVDMMASSPLACRNGSQASQFPHLPDVISGNPNRIEFKMERGGLNYGLSKGDGLKTFNKQVESMKVVGTNETCKPG